jgi:CheY-like chemotaxis protein
MDKNKKCILVIDDDDDVCQIVKEKFGGLGYRVVIAYGGTEGFQKTQEEKPDCVLLDIRIPKGEDGLTYLRKIRSCELNDIQEQTRMRKTPVIVLTGVGISMKALFEAEGISGFVEKPFDVTKLNSEIQRALK